MQWDLVLNSQSRQGWNIIDNPVREIGSGPDQQDRIPIDQATDRRNVNLVLRGRAGYLVKLDAEVAARLVEGRMGRFRNNPGSTNQK